MKSKELKAAFILKTVVENTDQYCVLFFRASRKSKRRIFIEPDKIIDKFQSSKNNIYCSDGEWNITIISNNHFSPAMFGAFSH